MNVEERLVRLETVVMILAAEWKPPRDLAMKAVMDRDKRGDETAAETLAQLRETVERFVQGVANERIAAPDAGHGGSE